MKKFPYLIATTFLTLIIVCSCGSPKPAETEKETDQKTLAEVEIISNQDAIALSNKWNEANSTKDVGILSNLYDKRVMYYGMQMDKNECIENKLAFFNKKTDFKQEIVGEVIVENISNSEIKCIFTKKVTVDGNTTDYPSYLQFRKVGEEWKISVEGDLVTDENLAKRVEKKNLSQEMGERHDVSGTYDFNGDGKKELCYLLEPKKYNDEDHFMECEGECNCLIMFSDSNIPPIEVESCIGGKPKIYGDLDGNGTIEIGIWPWWWTSCWHTFYIYTLVDGEWEYFVEPFSVHCNLMDELEESGEPIITPVEGQKGMFKIRYSYFDEEKGIMDGAGTVKKLTK